MVLAVSQFVGTAFHPHLACQYTALSEVVAVAAWVLPYVGGLVAARSAALRGIELAESPLLAAREHAVGGIPLAALLTKVVVAAAAVDTWG